METSLHRDLKTLYAGQDAQFEVSLGDYRIDVMSGGRLIEKNDLWIGHEDTGQFEQLLRIEEWYPLGCRAG